MADIPSTPTGGHDGATSTRIPQNRTDVPAGWQDLAPRVTEALVRHRAAQPDRGHKGRHVFRCFNDRAHTHGDKHPSAQWTEATGLWWCPVCRYEGQVKDGGGTIGLARLLDDVHHTDLLTEPRPPAKRKPGRPRGRPDVVAELAEARGLDPEALRKVWGLQPTRWHGRPAVRYRSPNGTDRVKVLDGHRPKYAWHRPLQGKPSAVPYGLAQAMPLLQRQRADGLQPTVWLVNGEPSVWACHQAGVPAVCWCTTEGAGADHVLPVARQVQADLAAEGLADATVMVAFDNDPTGHTGAHQQAAWLTQVGLTVGRVADLSGHPSCVHIGADAQDLHRAVGDAGLADALASLPDLPRPQAAAILGQLGIMTAADLLAKDVPPTRWLVPDLVPWGSTALVGASKSGKSWFALSAAWSLASGTKVLGSYLAPKPLTVLYLGLEDSESQLQGRLQTLTGHGVEDVPPQLLVRCMADNVPPLPDFVGWLDRARMAAPIDLVIVDVYKKIRPLGKAPAGGTLYDVDSEHSGMLHHWAKRHDVCLWLLHHTRKATAFGGDDWLDRASGSTGLLAPLDTVMLLDRDRGADAARLMVTSRAMDTGDLERDGLAMTFDRQWGSWQGLGMANTAEAMVKLMPEHHAQIVQALDELGGTGTPADVCQVLAVPTVADDGKPHQEYETIRQRMWQLARKGALAKAGRGVYMLPEAADQADGPKAPRQTMAEGDRKPAPRHQPEHLQPVLVPTGNGHHPDVQHCPGCGGLSFADGTCASPWCPQYRGQTSKGVTIDP